MPTRKASATWEGGLKGGKGSFKAESGVSGAYSFGSRFENAPQSNPEELLAAAEAACYSMALSVGLEKNGTPPTRVRTDAACTIDKVGDGFKITRMRLEVRISGVGYPMDTGVEDPSDPAVPSPPPVTGQPSPHHPGACSRPAAPPTTRSHPAAAGPRAART